jgi:hypothetical protein
LPAALGPATNKEVALSSQEAKQILLRYRPDVAVDADDPEVSAALALVQSDPELRAWFEQHCAFQRKMRDEFRILPVPATPRLQPKIVHGPESWWSRRAAIAAAAATVAAVGISLWVWLRPNPPNRFENYRTRMVSTVLREYNMDIETTNMVQLREFLGQKGAPSDYRVPSPLEPVPLTGGGVLTWRGQPVSMICFDRGQKEMVFLFVIDRAALPNPPPAQPEFSQVSKLATASWTEGKTAYLLATETNKPSVLRKYL